MPRSFEFVPLWQIAVMLVCACGASIVRLAAWVERVPWSTGKDG